MKKSTTDTTPRRTATEKRQAAARTAAWRERKKVLEVRDLDRVLSEAVAIYARSLVPADQKKFLATIVDLAAGGLEYQGHDAGIARNRTIDRLAHWVGNDLNSGCVRAVVDRKRILSTSRATA